MLLRGVFRRCPNCGSRGIFHNWFQLKERCPRCGMTFEREEGFFLGAYTINFAVVLGLLAIWILVGVIATQPNPPLLTLILIGAALSAVVAVGFYPSSKSLWSAIDLIMTPLRPEEHRARAR